MSQAVAPNVFTDNLLHVENLTSRLLSNQLHQIPDWSVVQKHKTKRINLAIFSNQVASKLKKQSGELYDVVTVNDLSLAIVDYGNQDRLTKQIEAILIKALQQSLSIETIDQLQSFAKRKQFDITMQTNLNFAEIWQQQQKRIEKSKCLDELQAAVRVLNKNSFESNQPIYEGMTAATLLDMVFEQL